MDINPALQRLMGLFCYREEMNIGRLIAFAVIRTGIFITPAEKLQMIRQGRRKL